MCDELEVRGEEQTGEGKGVRTERARSRVDEGFIYRMTFTTGSWDEPILKVLEGPQSDNILPPLSLVPVRGTNQC